MGVLGRGPKERGEGRMSRRCFAVISITITVVALAPVFAAAQSANTTAPPRTPWGQPDLQGVWDFRTITSLERPSDLVGKQVLTDEEAANYEALENRRQNRDLVDPKKGGALYPPESEGGVVPYNEFWYDRGTTVVEDKRTSLIVDPPDGRLPPLRPGTAEEVGSAGEDLPGHRPVWYRAGGIGADGPKTEASGSGASWGSTADRP